MPHTSAQLKNELSATTRQRISEQIYLSGFKKSDCDYAKLHLTWATDPLSKDYYSPLNPCFSYEPKTPELLNIHPCWLVRDGALALLDGLVNQKFLGLKTTLILNPKLQVLLPEYMQKESLYFDLISTDTRTKKCEKVLIYTVVNGAFSSPDYIEKLLLQIKQDFPKVKDSDFHIMMLLRENQFYQVESDAVHPAFDIPKVVHKVMPKATLINEREFSTIKDFSNWKFFEAQESAMVIGDSFLQHKLLSLGAQHLYQPLERNDAEIFPQSPLHAVRVFGPSKDARADLYDNAIETLAHLDKHEKKIKSYWVPPYSENPTFGCFYKWLRTELADG